MPMRILIVDDHPVTRDGLRSALSITDEVEIIGEAASGEEAIDYVDKLKPEVVFMDVRMPGMGGIEATRIIKQENPETRVILFTVDESRQAISEAIQAGVSGYLLKDVTPAELVNAARLALENKAVIHPALRSCGPNEIANLLKGLAGRFVPPGSSGAPTRGRLDVLPTGRNFYSLDNRTVPTPTAWNLGQKSAEDLLVRHFQDFGQYPRSLGLSAWGAVAPYGVSSVANKGPHGLSEILYAFSSGAGTPIYVPIQRLREELAKRGFTDFAEFYVARGTALLARKGDPA